VTPTENVLENAVVAGNAIGAGSGGELAGAGLYVGCSPSPTHPNHLALVNSTVTENTSPAGGVAGLAGNPGDQLALANSIVAGDVGGAELGGFGGPGGSLSAVFSDVCASGASTPLAGEGNLCASPRLADEGNPASFDVHETAESPTIDAGRNALVPGGLLTDVFGNARVLPGHAFLPPCTPGAVIGLTYGPTVVDMGASEFGPLALASFAIQCPSAQPKTSSFAFPSVIQSVNGLLTLVFKTLAAGHVTVKATYKRTRAVFRKVKGHRRRVRTTKTLTYGTASYTASSTKSVKLKLKPTAQALKLLARVKRLKVLVTITYTQTGLLPAVQSQTITVRYKAPPRHKRHHH
jgi:hypothetical protein